MPIWHDDALIADETVDYGHGEAQAKRFVAALADRLGVDPQHVIPAYEDVWYYLWRERRLPANVDPLTVELKDEEERARLARIFEQGLDSVVGYVLPLRRESTPNPGARWVSGAWFLRPEHLFLIPGDSPMGFRLPLDSLPWVAPNDDPHVLRARSVCRRRRRCRRAQSVTVQRRAGARRGPRRRRRGPDAAEALENRPRASCAPRSASSRATGGCTSSCRRSRSTEDYLDLVAAIEETAAS